MRRFIVHLMTEIDFIDGDEVSDEAAQNYQKHLSDTLRNAAQEISLRTPESRLSRSQKSRMNSNARLRGNVARKHARQRRSLRHRGVRQLRPPSRCQRRCAARNPDSPRGLQTPPLQQLRRQDDIDATHMANREPTPERSRLSA
jgi:hypothetical protein